MSEVITPIAQVGGPGTTTTFRTFPEYARQPNQGPLFLRNGYKILQAKNFGGMYPGGVNPPIPSTRTMWPQQWTWAKERGYSWAEDQQLIDWTRIMVDDYGIKKIIWYVGGRVVLPDPLRDGRYHLAPFIATAKVPGVTIEFCFDTDSWFGTFCKETPEFKLAMQHNRELRDQGIGVSMEARPELGDHHMIGQICASLSLTWTEGPQHARQKEAWLYGDIRRDPGLNSAAAHQSIRNFTDTFGPNKTHVTPIVRRPDLSTAAEVTSWIMEPQVAAAGDSDQYAASSEILRAVAESDGAVKASDVEAN